MSENLRLPTRAINEWLKQATAELAAAGVPSARLDAELILAHTLRKPRTYLHAHVDEVITERHEEIANARIALRKDFVPVAYIIGHKEFYGRPFRVTNATLVPRPESERLIELLKTIMPQETRLLQDDPLRLVDVGTGSGVLGITAKCEYPELDVTLLDTSRHALRIAEQNARAHNAEVTVAQSDLLANYPFTADTILANLPYVDPSWERNQETNHEPEQALFARNNGLALIFELIIQSRNQLRTGGWIVLEADPRQHTAITEHATQNGLVVAQTDGFGMLLQKLR